MNKYYSLVLLFFAIAFNSSAQQIKANNTLICDGYPSLFSIPRFALPPSTNIETYTFYVGADTVTTTENEYSVWFAPGTYSATAKIVLSNDSVLHTNTIMVTVTHKPVANFSFTNGPTVCSSDIPVCVTNTTTSALPIAHSQWYWGDNTMIDTTSAGACHQYAVAGLYSVQLSLTDSIGCHADTSFTVTIGEKVNPTIQWEGQPGCGNSKYLFKNNYNQRIQSYSWNFGDGQSYSATSPFTDNQRKHIDSITHTYTVAGPFTPTLSLTDSSGCSVVASNPWQQTSNIVISNNIVSSTHYWDFPNNQQSFCTKDNTIYFRLEDEDALHAQAGYPTFLWDFGDPMSMYMNYSQYNQRPNHQFMGGGGQYIVKLDLSQSLANCIFYDTITLIGPEARIENPSAMVTIASNQKHQITGADTVDFVNTTKTNGATIGFQYVWDFDDDFAPRCTAYSVPKLGAVLPFLTALEQYNNSDHFYIVNGTTFSGKMNCRWSLDSLPRHKYTNWDTVSQWYQTGKTFPSAWGLPAIQPNTSVVHHNSFTDNLYDPFLLAAGILEPIPNNKDITPNGSISYYIAKYDTTIYRNGTDVLPNSTQTFYEYIFNHTIVSPYYVRLNVSDSLGTMCSSQNTVTLSFGKPDALNLTVTGKQCAGGAPNGVVFNFPQNQNTFVLINFDSLADRKDASPCNIDGFVGYHGGTTPGGLSFPPFFSGPNFIPPTMWQNGTGSQLYYHYGLNAPANRPPPADTLNGFVTIGLIMGSGCKDTLTTDVTMSTYRANQAYYETSFSSPVIYASGASVIPGMPSNYTYTFTQIKNFRPFVVSPGVFDTLIDIEYQDCSWPNSFSDTVWYHNIIRIRNLDSRFYLSTFEGLASKNKAVTAYANEAYQPHVKSDVWLWGDGTMTVDSFWYAEEHNLPQDLTNGYFVDGKRRVRYNNITNENSDYVLIDSIEFPCGFPGSRINIDTLSSSNLCEIIGPDAYQFKDSAMMILPVEHIYTRSSYEVSENPASPSIGNVIHIISNGIDDQCYQYNINSITVGIIDSIESIKNNQNSSVYCAGEQVEVKGFARYFRCENRNSELPWAPNYSCATGVLYDYPYSALNFDTLDFWRVAKNQTADIKYTYLNPYTQKQDTIYYEKMFWNFGDGSPVVAGLNAAHNYTSPGTYTITMFTRDSVGGWDSCYKDIIVSGPVAKIGFPLDVNWPYEPKNVFTCGEVAQFIDSSDVPNSEDQIKNSYWWFGDRGDSIDWQLRNPGGYVNHPYTANGLFNIKLVTETELGCTDTARATIYISGPRPAFKVLSDITGCAPYTVKLVNQADLFGKFIHPNGTTMLSDTPTRTTYFYFGDSSSPVPVTLRRDTLEYTFTSEGAYNIVAIGSDAPVGLPSTCFPLIFPNTAAGNAPVTITVRDVNTNGIVGKSKVALSADEYYSVSRTPSAAYHWTTIGGTIMASNADSSTINIVWSTTDGNYQLICHKSTSTCFTIDTLSVAVGNPPAGQDETSLNSVISIYPNPASNQFTIMFKTAINHPVKLSLFDMVGKKQIEKVIDTQSSSEHTFSIQGLKPGMYLIEVNTENKKHIQKLLVE